MAWCWPRSPLQYWCACALAAGCWAKVSYSQIQIQGVRPVYLTNKLSCLISLMQGSASRLQFHQMSKLLMSLHVKTANLPM